jgi:hypothetical protein
VAYEATDGTTVVGKDRFFHAPRTGRYHVGVDLYGKVGDLLIASEDGKIVAF